MLILVTMCTEDYTVPHFSDGNKIDCTKCQQRQPGQEAAMGGPCEISFNFDENRAWD